MNVFETLNQIDVGEHIEKKNGLSYLSWAWAWTELKKKYPTAQYTVYERDTEFGEVNYFTDGMTCWVKVSITIEDLEHIEYLPVMDFKNKSIPLDKVTSMDVNKAIQRGLTKALARHGLGLYIYAGEDLPESSEEPSEKTISEFMARQNEMTSLEIDFREAHNKWICTKAKVQSQDLTKLKESELERLITVYNTLIKGKKAQNEKPNAE